MYLAKASAGKHRGLGVHLVDSEYEKVLKELYQEGKKCGSVKN